MGLFGNAKKFLQNEKERKIIEFSDVIEKDDCFIVGNKKLNIKNIKNRQLIANVIEKVEEDKLYYAKAAVIDGIFNLTRIDDFDAKMIKNEYLDLCYKLITDDGDAIICKMDKFKINSKGSMERAHDALLKLSKLNLNFDKKLKSNKEEKRIDSRLKKLIDRYDFEKLKKEEEEKNTKTTSF